MENIKSYRESELRAYAIANVFLILFSSGYLEKIVRGESSTFLALSEELITSAVFSTIVYCYVFLADSVIPGNIKQWLCFPCGMPAGKIFTRIKEGKCRDPRIDRDKCFDQYKEFYSKNRMDEKIENSFWMDIYRKYEKSTRILVSQRDFLLCRDMMAMTICVLFLYVVLGFLGFINVQRRIIIVFLFEGFLTLLAAKNKGWRFAYNVISEDLHEPREEKTEEGKNIIKN